MTIVVGARDARLKFAELLGRVGYGGEIAVVQRAGKPMVAIIPMELYERLVAEREARFQVIDRIQARQPDAPPEEVERDVTEAVQAVRDRRAARRD